MLHLSHGYAMKIVSRRQELISFEANVINFMK